MIHAFRAEWFKLQRKGMLLGGAGTIIAICALIVILLYATAQSQLPPPPGPPQPGQRQPGPTFLLASFEGSNGFALAFSFAGQLIGVVALVLFAQSTGSEYTQGTLKVQLSREPRRLILLGGKATALGAFVGAAILVAFLLQALVVVIMALARGIDMTAWWTAEGWASTFAVLGRVVASSMVWGSIGMFLGVLLRSAAPAIGIGIGYTLVGEQLLTLAWDSGRQILPGQVLSAFAAGGNDALGLGAAGVLVSVYAVGFLIASGAIFRTRDVSS